MGYGDLPRAAGAGPPPSRVRWLIVCGVLAAVFAAVLLGLFW